MARNDLVICGFEQGPLASSGTTPSELDNVFGQCKISSTQKRSGTYSLLLDYVTAAANTQGDLPFSGRGSSTQAYRRVAHWLRIDDPGADSHYTDVLWLWQWPVGGVGLVVLSSGPPSYNLYLGLYGTSGGSKQSLGSYQIAYDTDYLIELYWFDDATSPAAKLYIDGVERISSTDALLNQGSTETKLHFGESLGKGITERYQPYMDDFWVMDSDSISDTIPDPLPKIVVALPNLDGDSEEFTGYPDTTDHYANVDDAPADSKDDTSYNQSGTDTGQKSELYEFESCADIGLASYDVIAAVQTSCVAKVTTGSDGQPSILVKDDGSEYTTNVAPTSQYADGAYTRLDVVQPNGGAAWTQARVDALQAGMRRGAGSTPRNLRLTSEMLMIAYQEGTPTGRRRGVQVV